jgi:hypothetical protein
MQEKSTMECIKQWMRTFFTEENASTIHVSGADAMANVLVYAPYSNPLLLVAVDMAQKNSVIAKCSK